MSLAQEYIDKIEQLPPNATEGEKEALVKDAVSVFSEAIPGIKKGLDQFSGRAGGIGTTMRFDNDGDLRKLLDKLRLLKEEEARSVAADPLRSATAKIDSDIERCARALASGNAEACDKLVDTLVSVYESDVPSIAYKLTTYGGSHDGGYDHFADLRLVKERLELHQGKVAVEAAAALKASPSVSVSGVSNAASTVNVEIGISQASQQVQSLSEDVLSAEGKKELKLLLLSLEEMRGKPKNEAHPKLKKVLSWLADKGVDVAIAALPYIKSLLDTLN